MAISSCSAAKPYYIAHASRDAILRPRRAGIRERVKQQRRRKRAIWEAIRYRAGHQRESIIIIIEEMPGMGISSYDEFL